MKSRATPFLIGGLILALLLAGVMATPAISQEEPPSLTDLARMIRDGEIEITAEYGMGEDQRFHVIHSDIIDMSCKQCHVREAPFEIGLPYVEDEKPVDRRVCLGCHLNGPATPLYDPKE